MKSTMIMALSALATLALATPVEKRQQPEQTVTITDTVIIDVIITVDGPAPASPSADNHQNHMAYHASNGAYSSNNHQSPLTSSSTQAAVSFQAAQPAPSSPAPAPAASSPAAGTAQTPEQIQAAANAKQAAVNQQQIDTNNAQKASDFQHQNEMYQLQNGGNAGAGQPQSQPQSQAPAQAPAPSAQSQTPAVSQPAPAPAQSAPSTGGGGSCGQIGGQCSGDVTTYNDQGLGACGWQNDTNSQDFVALAQGMFGTYTNDAPGPHKNAFCGRQIAITVNGQQFSGTITDRCGGCEGQDIDLSQHLFSKIYPNQPPGNGRYHNVPWSFTNEGPYHGPS